MGFKWVSFLSEVISNNHIAYYSFQRFLRLIMLSFVNIFNISVCIFLLLTLKSDDPVISGNLMMIFAANMILYLLYYIMMKFVCGERLLWHLYLFLGLFCLFLIPAGYFFMSNKERTTTATPSQSRSMNQVQIYFFLTKIK